MKKKKKKWRPWLEKQKQWIPEMSILRTGSQSTGRHGLWEGGGLMPAFMWVTLLLPSGQTQHQTAGLDWDAGPQKQNSNWITHKQSQQRGSSADQSTSVPSKSESKEKLHFSKTSLEVPGETTLKFFQCYVYFPQNTVFNEGRQWWSCLNSMQGLFFFFLISEEIRGLRKIKRA